MNMPQFVIGQKNEFFVIFNKLVTAAAVGVADRNGKNSNRANVKLGRTGLLIFDFSLYIRISYRKIGRRHDL